MKASGVEGIGRRRKASLIDFMRTFSDNSFLEDTAFTSRGDIRALSIG